MGHATHFLERLERLSSLHVEWALHMYRDPELVRMVLAAAKIPENASRVALSLDDPVTGPFVIVDRSGQFITCLGEGMKQSKWPVVERYVLDNQVPKLEELRARKAIFDQTLQRYGSLHRLFRRIWDAGPKVSREEMIAASTMVPAIRHMLWNFLIGLLDPFMMLMRKLVAGQYEKRIKRPTDQDLEDMRGIWNIAWQMGHAYVLCGMSVDEENTPPARLVEKEPIRFDPTWMASRVGMLAIVIRGGWCVAQHGKLFLWGAKQRFTNHVETPTTFISSFSSLYAIALKSPKSQGEICKTFDKFTADRMLLDDKIRSTYTLTTEFASKLVRVLNTPGALPLDAVKGSFYKKIEHLRNTYSKPEDIPDDVMITAMANDTGSTRGSFGLSTTPLIAVFPHVMKRPGECLYFPEKELSNWVTPWTPEDTIDTLLTPYREESGSSSPVVHTGPKIGRNERCPCNSGKKHKVCCGK